MQDMMEEGERLRQERQARRERERERLWAVHAARELTALAFELGREYRFKAVLLPSATAPTPSAGTADDATLHLPPDFHAFPVADGHGNAIGGGPPEDNEERAQKEVDEAEAWVMADYGYSMATQRPGGVWDAAKAANRLTLARAMFTDYRGRFDRDLDKLVEGTLEVEFPVVSAAEDSARREAAKADALRSGVPAETDEEAHERRLALMDPFCDLDDARLIGKAEVYLDAVNSALVEEVKEPVIGYNGRPCGHLQVSMTPHVREQMAPLVAARAREQAEAKAKALAGSRANSLAGHEAEAEAEVSAALAAAAAAVGGSRAGSAAGSRAGSAAGSVAGSRAVSLSDLNLQGVAHGAAHGGDEDVEPYWQLYGAPPGGGGEVRPPAEVARRANNQDPAAEEERALALAAADPDGVEGTDWRWVLPNQELDKQEARLRERIGQQARMIIRVKVRWPRLLLLHA